MEGGVGCRHGHVLTVSSEGGKVGDTYQVHVHFQDVLRAVTGHWLMALRTLEKEKEKFESYLVLVRVHSGPSGDVSEHDNHGHNECGRRLKIRFCN